MMYSLLLALSLTGTVVDAACSTNKSASSGGMVVGGIAGAVFGDYVGRSLGFGWLGRTVTSTAGSSAGAAVGGQVAATNKTTCVALVQTPSGRYLASYDYRALRAGDVVTIAHDNGSWRIK